jgi:hypothetical protein
MLYTYAWWGLWTTCSNQELIGDFNSPEKNSLGAIIPKCSWKSEKHMKPSTRQVWKSKICYWFILQLKNEDKHFATKKKGDVVHQQNSVPSQEMLVENFKKQLLGLNIKLWYSDPKKKIEFREIRPKSGKIEPFRSFWCPKKIIKREKEDFKQHRRWVKLRSSALALSVLCENRPQNFMENHEFSHWRPVRSTLW